MRIRLAMIAYGLVAAALICVPGEALAQARQAMGTTGLTLDQIVIKTGSRSTARGAPNTLGISPTVGPVLNPDNSPLPFRQEIASAKGGGVPKGVKPLDRTIFTSRDFYLDRDLWMDPRYYNCASGNALEALWGAYQVVSTGDRPPATIPWGYCDRDLDRKALISPYPFDTARQHYEALLAEAKARGGPTIHTAKTLPKWSGVYQGQGFMGNTFGGGMGWLDGGSMQIPTYLSLLTPEYQQRYVQQEYHYAHDNAAQWPGAYCWPEGFMRRFITGFDRWIQMTPEMMSLWTDASETMMTHVNIGRQFSMEGGVPRLGDDVRRWYGETVGFWDGDILITWTSNIRDWYAHGWFEFSDKMQSIEIYSPITDAKGKFVGINREAVLYDPEALVDPIRVMENWEWSRGLSEGNPFDWRTCVQTLFPIKGRQTPVNPNQTIEYTVPDMSSRPWAAIWEKYFEQGMKRPGGAEEAILSDFAAPAP